MDTGKNLLLVLGEWWEAKRTAAQKQPAASRPRAIGWLGQQLIPNLGSVLLVLILLSVFPGLAAPLNGINATSISTIPYQGRLADASGNPVTGKQNIEFRLYNTPTGNTPLWEEFWTGANSVDVSDGLFSVMLGSINTGLTAVVQGNNNLYLGITVGTDSEMVPRVQLGGVPYSMQSLTVPDGSITQEKLAPGLNLVPPGTIVMWSGSLNSIPDGWSLCDGTNGTPDLRDRFIVGAGGSYNVGNTGGIASVTLTLNQIPAHTHSASSSAAGAHNHTASSSTSQGTEFSQSSSHGGGVYYGMGTIQYNNNQRLGTHSHDITVNEAGSHTHPISIGNAGEGQAHENRPPYYGLAFIMKLP